MNTESDSSLPKFPDKDKIIEKMTMIQEPIFSQPNNPSGPTHYSVPPFISKGMADIATNAWKARSKMLNGRSGEVREEMKRVFRHIEGIIETLKEMGLDIKDHTGDPFDYGLPLKVVTTQPEPGITKERVIETIKPSIYWQKRLIQMGEVVIATPI
jgi:hypothetical protein